MYPLFRRAAFCETNQKESFVMMQSPNVVFLSTKEPENAVLQRILDEYAIVTPVNGLTELLSVLERNDCDAVFCGWSFQAGTWSTALERLRDLCPDLPVIVFCPIGGEQEWTEVLDAGAFDLLSLPYRRDTVIPMLEHAVASRAARKRWSGATEQERIAS